jgi:hypothetical protein
MQSPTPTTGLLAIYFTACKTHDSGQSAPATFGQANLFAFLRAWRPAMSILGKVAFLGRLGPSLGQSPCFRKQCTTNRPLPRRGV